MKKLLFMIVLVTCCIQLSAQDLKCKRSDSVCFIPYKADSISIEKWSLVPKQSCRSVVVTPSAKVSPTLLNQRIVNKNYAPKWLERQSNCIAEFIRDIYLYKKTNNGLKKRDLH